MLRSSGWEQSPAVSLEREGSFSLPAVQRGCVRACHLGGFSQATRSFVHYLSLWPSVAFLKDQRKRRGSGKRSKWAAVEKRESNLRADLPSAESEYKRDELLLVSSWLCSHWGLQDVTGSL